MEEEIEYLFTVAIVGHTFSGKWNIIDRYVNNKFSAKVRSYCSCDTAIKSIEWSPTEQIRLRLWRMGEDRRTTVGYYDKRMLRIMDVNAAVIVYDITTPEASLNAIIKWKSEFEAYSYVDGKPIPVVLAVNKVDLPDVKYDRAQMAQIAQSFGFDSWIETSTKEDINISKMFKYIYSELMSRYSIPEPVFQLVHDANDDYMQTSDTFFKKIGKWWDKVTSPSLSSPLFSSPFLSPKSKRVPVTPPKLPMLSPPPSPSLSSLSSIYPLSPPPSPEISYSPCRSPAPPNPLSPDALDEIFAL